MEAALAGLSEPDAGPDAEGEYEAAKQALAQAYSRIVGGIPGGQLENLVDTGAGGILASAAYVAEGVHAAAWQRELGFFRKFVDSFRRSISLFVATIGEVSVVPPLPRDREALRAIVDETGRYADAATRFRAVRLAILELSRTPGAQEECDAACEHLDSIRNGRPRSEVYPEIMGRYPSFDALNATREELDQVRPLVKRAVEGLAVSREYLYDDDLPQHPSEWAAALQAGGDAFDKLIAKIVELNQDAREALRGLDDPGLDEPFDPAVPATKPLPADRALLRQMLDELTAHLKGVIPVREAYAQRKRLQRSPEVRQALGLVADGLRRTVKGDVPLVSLERIEASCPELKKILELSAFIDAYFKDHQVRNPLVLSGPYLETPRNRRQLRALLNEMGPDGDFGATLIKPCASLHRKIMDELAKPAEDIPETAAIDAPIFDALRRENGPLTTGKLLSAMNAVAEPGKRFPMSTLKKRLADLVKLGRLTNKPDAPGRGYYLAEWQTGS
ncbi:hypothetical protein [Paludisphaera sp.]|uniref:hypothetical protein n=1 Tax=Paludisphaera sp. TaxID=2017432 RepID=UPI00301D57AE